MPTSKRDPDRLLDMLENAQAIANLTLGKSYADFRGDEEFRLIVERRLEIIGMAATRVSDQFRFANPQIPWSQFIGIRRALDFEYGQIDNGRVWSTIETSLSPLTGSLQAILAPPPDPEP
jgi:uncharacterized protein with HEPN domain